MSLAKILDSAVAEALAWALLHSLWQGTLVAVLLAVALALIGMRPAARHAAAGLALALMLLLPAVTFVWLLPGSIEQRAPVPAQVEASTPARGSEGASAMPAASRVPPADVAPTDAGGVVIDSFTARRTFEDLVAGHAPTLVAGWLLGMLVLLARLVGGLVVVARWRRLGVSPPPAELLQSFKALASRLGLRPGVLLRVSSRVDVPLVLGVIKPIVLVPASAVSGLPWRDLELLLAHELAHVRRHDLLMNALQRLAETLLYFHPAVWWASGVMRKEREHACDELAVQATGGDRLKYARALARLEESRTEHVFAAAANSGSLISRVERLLGRSGGNSGPRSIVVLLALLTCGVLALTGLAQEPDATGEYRTLWATVTEGVEFDEVSGRIASIPEGDYVLLEERIDGVLVRKALMVNADLADRQADELTDYYFRASRDSGMILLPEVNVSVRFENGPKAERGLEEQFDWFNAVFDEAVIKLMRQVPHEVGPGAFGYRTYGLQEDQSVTLLFGDFEGVSNDFWRDLRPSGAGWRQPIRAVTHVLAHGVQGEAQIEAFLLGVLREVETVDRALALDLLRAIPRFSGDEFKLELLEALALRLGELPTELEEAFERAVASVRDREDREAIEGVFEADYGFSLRPGLQPFWFTFGSLNMAEWRGGGRSGWFAQMGAIGRVDRSGALLSIIDPRGRVLDEVELTSEFTRISFSSFASEIPSGVYTLIADYLGNRYELEVEVDGSSLLPLPTNVRVFQEEVGPVVEWDPIPEAAFYEVEIAKEEGGFVKFLVDEARAEVLSHTSHLAPGTHRIQTIRAFSQEPDCAACEVRVSQSGEGPSFEITGDDLARDELGPTTLWVTLVAEDLPLAPELSGLDGLGEFEVLRVEERSANLAREAVVRPNDNIGEGLDINYRENGQAVALDDSDRIWLEEAATQALQHLVDYPMLLRLREEQADEREGNEVESDAPDFHVGETGGGLDGVDEQDRYYSIEFQPPGTGPGVLSPQPDPSPSAISRIHHLIAHGLAELDGGVDAYAEALETGTRLRPTARVILDRLLAEYSPRVRNAWRNDIDLKRATLIGDVELTDDYGAVASIEGDGLLLLDEYEDAALLRAAFVRGQPLEVTVIEPASAGADDETTESPYGPLSTVTYPFHSLPADVRAWFEEVFADTVSNLYLQTPAEHREAMAGAWDNLTDGTRVSIEVREAGPRGQLQFDKEGEVKTPVLQLFHLYSHGLIDGEELREGLRGHLSAGTSQETVREVKFVVEQLSPGIIFLDEADLDPVELWMTLSRPAVNPWRLPGLDWE